MHAVLSCPDARVRFDIVSRRVCAIRFRVFPRTCRCLDAQSLARVCRAAVAAQFKRCDGDRHGRSWLHIPDPAAGGQRSARQGANQFLVVADPLFVDIAGADYHLQPFSNALDRAAASTGSGELGNDVDLDGNPRAVDLPGVNDSLGKPRDLGAYELQSLPPGCRRADTIFCSGFELQ